MKPSRAGAGCSAQARSLPSLPSFPSLLLPPIPIPTSSRPLSLSHSLTLPSLISLFSQTEKSNTLIVTSTGSSSSPLTELEGLLSPEKASFAYVRVKYANDEESFREKFVLIVWIGADVKVMRRAKVS